jgi:cytochrome P450
MLNLTPGFRNAERSAEKIKRAIMACYRERFDADPGLLENNFMDIMVKKNKESGGKDFQEKEIIANIKDFLYVATDDIYKAATGTIYELGCHPELCQKIRSEASATNLLKTDNIFEAFDHAPILDAFFKENLRVHSGTQTMIERVATCDFTLGKYKFRKGDAFSIALAHYHKSKNCVKGVDKFDISIFSDGVDPKTKLTAFIPFSAGKRSCPGRFLGEMVVKTLSTVLLDLADLETDEINHKAVWQISDEYLLNQCIVKCSLIKDI